MRFAKAAWLVAAVLTAWVSVTTAAPIKEEHVTGGNLDLVWAPGFGVTANMAPATLAPGHPAYNNPSGDHTVAVATSMPVDSGGIILTATDPLGFSDYIWEGWIFTGDGNTRRGLALRADPTNNFESCYQFVIQAGLFQFNFRKLINSSPTTLGTWFASALPALPQVNQWHHMQVIAVGSSFRCFWDGFELTSTPITDTSLPSGWVGVYNFRADIGSVPFYTDDLLLTPFGPTAANRESWGAIKARYARP